MSERFVPPVDGELFQSRRRLPIGVQVTLGVAGLLGLLLVSVVAAIVVVVGMGNDQAQINGRERTYGEAVDAAALNAKGIANDERGFLLSGDRSFIDESEPRIAAARTAFADAQAAVSGAQRKAIDQARAGFENWIAAIDHETAAFLAGDRRAAIDASLGASREVRKRYEQSLARAKSLDTAELDSAKTSVEDEASRSVRTLTVLLGLALTVGLLIPFWLVRAIAIPVARLVALLSSLGGSAVPSVD
jgi:methyl-accepting chemotaxis protein